MNFLKIAQRTRQEAGYSGSGPTSVESQVGVLEKIVNWVQMAYTEVQQANPLWGFRWATYNAPLTPGLAQYSPTANWGLNVRSIVGCPIYVSRAAEPAQRYWLAGLPWHEFRMLPPTPATAIPTYFSEAPDGDIHLYPSPMAGLKVNLEYQRRPGVLVTNMDIPEIPEEYHAAIMWRAVMYAAAHDENPALLQSATSNYYSILARMSMTELDDMSRLEPMA